MPSFALNGKYWLSVGLFKSFVVNEKIGHDSATLDGSSGLV